jgi:uncharacterized membrane protein YbhN (UPF0104 family)
MVAAGLLAYVAKIVSNPRSTGQLWAALQGAWWMVLLLTFPYLACRLYVWNDLMRELGLRIPWRPVLVSFAAGEMTKSIPGGIYLENYLLDRLSHLDENRVVRSTVATTALLGLEALLSLTVVLLLSVPGWTWVRWALLGIVAVWIGVLGLIWLLVHKSARLESRFPFWLRHLRFDAEQFLEAGRCVMRPRTLRDLPPTASYMLVYSADLYVIMRALGARHIGFVAIMTVYSVVVLAVILIPIPTDLGLAEISGLGALTAFGVERGMAAAIVLALRVLGTGATLLVAAVILVLFRGELSRAWKEEAEDESSETPERYGRHLPA